MKESDWRPIETIPQRLEGVKGLFKTSKGVIEDVWQPYWCGSDCPCGMTDSGELDYTLTPQSDIWPECWGLLRKDVTVTHWYPSDE